MCLKYCGGSARNAESTFGWGRPIVNLSQKVDHKGISLTKKAMEEIEVRLLRNPHLPKWDILIRPC